jgi:hypothetical protein
MLATGYVSIANVTVSDEILLTACGWDDQTVGTATAAQQILL